MKTDPQDRPRPDEPSASAEILDLAAVRIAAQRLRAFRSGGASFSALLMALIAPFNVAAMDWQAGDGYSQRLDQAAPSDPDALP